MSVMVEAQMGAAREEPYQWPRSPFTYARRRAPFAETLRCISSIVQQTEGE